MKAMKGINKEGREEERKRKRKQRNQDMKKMNENEQCLHNPVNSVFFSATKLCLCCPCFY